MVMIPWLASPSTMFTTNLLAKLGWPISNGELSSQLAGQRWVHSTERCAMSYNDSAWEATVTKPKESCQHGCGTLCQNGNNLIISVWQKRVTRTYSGAIYCQRKGGMQNLLLQFHLQSTVITHIVQRILNTLSSKRMSHLHGWGSVKTQIWVKVSLSQVLIGILVF